MPKDFTLILMALYFLGVLVVAKIFARKMTTLKDFYLAGKSLGVLPVAVAFVSAWFGAGSTMGSIGAIHDSGLNGLWMIIIPSFLSCTLITTVMAKRVAEQGTMSQPEAVAEKYGRGARLLMSIIILIAITNFVASQMVAGAKILHGVFGLDVLSATIATSAIVVVYSVIGGYFAVVVTDFAQLGMISISLLLMLGFTMTQSHSAPVLLPPTTTSLWDNIAMTISFVLAWSIAPEMWQRMSSTRQIMQAPKAGWTAMGMLAALFTVVTLIGFFSQGVLINPEHPVLVDLALQMPHPALSALVLIGFMAAVTSTMDSSLNAGSLTWTRDIYQTFIRPDASDRELIWVGRLATAVIAIPAIVIAVGFQDIIQVLWMSADVFASGMFVPVVGLLYVKNPGKLSGILAMTFGLVTVILSAIFGWPQPPYSTLLGVLLSAVGFGLGMGLKPSKSLKPGVAH